MFHHTTSLINLCICSYLKTQGDNEYPSTKGWYKHRWHRMISEGSLLFLLTPGEYPGTYAIFPHESNKTLPFDSVYIIFTLITMDIVTQEIRSLHNCKAYITLWQYLQQVVIQFYSNFSWMEMSRPLLSTVKVFRSLLFFYSSISI